MRSNLGIVSRLSEVSFVLKQMNIALESVDGK